MPFTDGEVQTWWCPDPPPPSSTFPPHLPLGPVVALKRVSDWLGDALVLVPPAGWHTYVHLEPARYAGPHLPSRVVTYLFLVQDRTDCPIGRRYGERRSAMCMRTLVGCHRRV